MKNKAGNQGLIYAKISAPDVVAIGEGLPFPKTYKLDVQDKKEIFNAKLGSEDGSEKHTVVDYDEISYFYANSRGIKPDESLFLEIRDSVLGRDPLLLQQVNVKADQNGIIKQKIIWNGIKNKVNLLTVYAIIKEKNQDGKVLYDADGDFSMATAKLRKGSTLVKIVENKGAVKVGDQPIGGSNCGGKFCIKKGSPKSELIREINIRLAGFGGNVPTDEFTDRTEKMVKQFQRDYMKVPETGKVCGNVLKAIDDFTSKWAEKISDYTCLCNGIKSIPNKCSGFGKGQYKDQYSSKTHVEKYHKYERPGMHRSLLWGVSALKYYLSIQNEYKYSSITAGYRCWEHNKYAGRATTNHMGKAVDIQFLKNNKLVAGKKEENLPILRDIRDKFYTKYLDSKYNWLNGNNNFSLEPFGLGNGQTWSWIHMDVREFDNVYLDDKFFTKTQDSLTGKSLTQLANELGLKDMCSCMGGGLSTNSNSNSKVGECICFKQGKVKTACIGKGSPITNDIYKKEADRLGIELAMIQAIAKQESKRESFWKEGQATILFERHKMWEYLEKDLNKTRSELEKLQKDDPSLVNELSGGYGKYSEQYDKLDKAKKIDNTTALKACSWGKFQVMGFNYSVAFSTPEEMEKAVNLCEIQQFYFFVGYIENTIGMITAMKNKNWEDIASKYNGSKWKKKNPDYASNIETYYNEYKKDK
ncbi:N-acetylmuramidase domain-containing protein [Chryseobacterium indologenes]